MSIPLVDSSEIVESCLDVFRESGGDQAGEWMRGTKRRCIDEYALAVKGGRIAYGGCTGVVCVGSSVCCLTDDCGGAIDFDSMGLGRAILIGGVPAYARNRRAQLAF